MRFRVWSCRTMWYPDDDNFAEDESFYVRMDGLVCDFLNNWDGGEIEEYPDYIPMLSTGLKDRKGKEIYEGDIIEVDWEDTRYRVHNFVVEWNKADLRFDLEGGCPADDVKHFTVVGNIHENPELIES